MASPSQPVPVLPVQHDLLRALFEATTDYLFFKDLDGCYLTINDAGAEFLGMTPAEIVGKNDFDLFPREIAERWVREDREVLTAGASITFEDQAELSGVKVYLETTKSPWRNESGEVIGTVGICRDVTEKKRTEQTLQEIESRFQKLFASDLMGIHIPDRFGAITEANDEFLRITGYSRFDLEAGLVRWDTMTPAEYHALDQEHIAEAAVRGACTPYEKEYVRKDGRRVPIMCGYTLLEGSQDQYIAFIQDLTALRKSEEAMRQAERLNTAGRFAASMAHEINNPLAAVTNLIYLALRNHAVQDDIRSLLEVADRELARISSVVAQTLRFHKQSTAPIFADVSEIMDSVFPLFTSRLTAHRIALEPEYSTHERLWCFHHELRHAFANLVGNALDATSDGGRLRIRVKRGYRRGHFDVPGILVIIADNGSGIPASMRPRMFEAFFSTKEKTGTGLGLWATENIVRKHRGRIAFRTANGAACHGTVFSLFLPFDGVQPPD